MLLEYTAEHFNNLQLEWFVLIVVTTNRRQLFYLFNFSSFFGFYLHVCIFGSPFRSHDSHVTGEHMVELGGHFAFVSSVSRAVILQETAPKLSSNVKWMDVRRNTTHCYTPLQQIQPHQVLIQIRLIRKEQGRAPTEKAVE